MIIEKWLILALLPLALSVLFIALIVYKTRGAVFRTFKLSGLGIRIEVTAEGDEQRKE